VLQRALANESRVKEKGGLSKSHRPVHILGFDSNNSDDEDKEVYAAELVWSSADKPTTCESLKPISKNRQEERKLSFDLAKCDKIFDELLKAGKIRLPHAMPPLDELKRRAYCKWHNTFSHATNDCNAFRRQIQASIDNKYLSFKDMQIDREPFPINVVELQDPKVLVRQHQSESTKGKDAIIGNEKGRPLATKAKPV